MNKGTKAVAIGSSVAVIAVILVAITSSAWSRGLVPGQFLPTSNTAKEALNDVVISSQNTPPTMTLTILEDDEDNSEGATSFVANNTTPISLVRGQHIRFESPDYRIPDSMKVIAMDSGGNIHILLKSYDVNNEFFVNIQKGNYELKVQARWLDQAYIYPFTIRVE